MRWPWKRRLVTDDEALESRQAVTQARRLRQEAAIATRQLLTVTAPNHLGERYHRALTGK